MTLAQYLRIARAKWLLIAIAVTLGGTGAATYSWLQTPVYSATAQMFITTRAAESNIATLSQGSTFTQQRVKSYAAVITAPDVLEPVIEDLAIPGLGAEGLASRVTASTPQDTVLLVLTVTDTSPTNAARIANAIATEFSSYVTQLELPSGKGTSPVKVTLTSPATPPRSPISPRKSFNLLLGLTLGLAMGVGGAVLRDSLDRTIGPKHDAGSVTSSPVLAGIVDDPEIKTSPLIIHNAFSPRAEAFRQLRTNIRFLSVDHEVRSLVVTSALAGEGKSTTAANLAIALAQGGDKVVLIDADLRRPSAGDLFGLTTGVGLTSVLLGDVPLGDAVQPWRDDLALWVLTSGPIPPNPSELIGSARMVQVVEQLVAEGYVVVVDSPPLLPVTDASILARITSGALLVVRARATRVEQLAAGADALRAAGAPILGVVVNCVPKSGRGYYYGSGGYAYTSKGQADRGGHPGPATSWATPAPASPDLGIEVVSTPPMAAPPRATPSRAAVPQGRIAHGRSGRRRKAPPPAPAPAYPEQPPPAAGAPTFYADQPSHQPYDHRPV
ncbi:MAG: polysaccharide biosynthesis tyrosine autokinase [Kineosporiaceae bacterium]